MSGLREEVIGWTAWTLGLLSLDNNTHRLFFGLFIFRFSGTEGAGADVWLEGGGGGRGLPGPGRLCGGLRVLPSLPPGPGRH